MEVEQKASGFKSLRFRIAAAVLFMLLLMLLTSGISFFYFFKLKSAVNQQSQQALPELQVLNSAQLNITRLANLAIEVSNSTSPAYSRILMSQVREQVDELKHSLELLGENNAQIKRLMDVVAKVEPSVTNISLSKSMLDQVDKALNERLFSAMTVTLASINQADDKEVKQVLGEITSDLAQLNTRPHLYEQNQITARLVKQMQQLQQQALIHYKQLEPLLLSPRGVLELLSKREIHNSEVVGLTTQNRILLGNIVDFGHRVYMENEAKVAQQAQTISKNSNDFINVLMLVLLVQLMVAVALMVYLHKHLFRRLYALKGLVGQRKRITARDVAFFDERNELGSLVKQLQTYLETISKQQAQIESTSLQLQSVIKHSHMMAAVIYQDEILYLSEPFYQLFKDRDLKSIHDFPDDFQQRIASTQIGDLTTLESAYWDVHRQSWFQVSKDNILWEGKKAYLISLTDVSSQVRAEQEFRKTLSVVESESKLDALTGLYNRKLFEDQVASLKLATEFMSFAVLLFDVDFFKQYNDKLGHLQGDQVLKMVASVIKRNTPSKGMAIRYGGEELLVFLPKANSSEALEIAQDIVEEVYQQHVPHPSSPHQYLSVSCGVSVQESSSDSLLKVFDQADKCLYQAKKSGRNRVTLWQDSNLGDSL